MVHHLHVLAVPHTVSNIQFHCCAYTENVVNFCKMMKRYTKNVVYHYGHEKSKVECDEHITVVTQEEQDECYKDHDWKKHYFKAEKEDKVTQLFCQRSIEEIGKRKARGHFILCFYGWHHQPVVKAHPDCIGVEASVGNYDFFSDYRIFVSYACMHANYGKRDITHPHWYDAVIPNFFDPDNFEFSAEKKDYLLFMGRAIPEKGVNIAVKIATQLNMKLVIAGTGDFKSDNPLIDFRGPVGRKKRKKLLRNAKCLILPTFYIEPFGKVVIESFFSGTPVVTSDWGGFNEINLHGTTGYRCRNMDQFIWAVKNIDRIDPHTCREWATRNYTLKKVSTMYQEYFDMMNDVWNRGGFYQNNPNRLQLSWLEKDYSH